MVLYSYSPFTKPQQARLPSTSARWRGFIVPSIQRCSEILACPADQAMSITIFVALASGRGVPITLQPDTPLPTLLQMAQEALERSLARLVTASGTLLDSSGNIQQAGIKDGDTLTAIARDVQVSATYGAFAALRPDASVVAWGCDCLGGDCSKVQDHLNDVQQIQACSCAFAALREDGSVVTWGGGYGLSFECDCPLPKGIRNVCQIQSSSRAFAGIRADGSVITWGDSLYGAFCELEVQSQLRNVVSIQASERAFAALRADGVVLSWGDPLYGGDSGKVRGELCDVLQLQSSASGFAAIKANGKVVCWGRVDPFPLTHAGSAKVQQVQMTVDAFSRTSVAIVDEKSHLFTWGPCSLKSKCEDISSVQTTGAGAFAAVSRCGRVLAWGCGAAGDSSKVQEQLVNVDRIQANNKAFAAIRTDGSVVTWGARLAGGDSRAVEEQLVNVRDVQATEGAFAALRNDGTVVAWGLKSTGGDNSAVKAQLRKVRSIQASACAFAAIRADGSVVTWPEHGASKEAGSSRKKQEQEAVSRRQLRLLQDATAATATGMPAAKARGQPKPKAKAKAKGKPGAKAKVKPKAAGAQKAALKRPSKK